jgi:hypothetical protein
MKSSNLLIAFAIVVGALFIAAGLVGASYLQSMNPQAAKSAAVDGCMMIAKGTDISGSIEQNGWTVEKTNMNNELYNDCMKKKGY